MRWVPMMGLTYGRGSSGGRDWELEANERRDREQKKSLRIFEQHFVTPTKIAQTARMP
jgi:hypothetical protein